MARIQEKKADFILDINNKLVYSGDNFGYSTGLTESE